MQYKNVIFNKEAHVGKVFFNRPEARNAFTINMIKEVVDVLTEVKNDPDVRVLLLSGTGKHFCTSTDMNEFIDEKKESLMGNMNPIEIREFLTHYPQRVTKLLIEMPKPTVVAVNGMALADAFDWVLACDLRIASTKASFVQGYLSMALAPNTGATWLLPRAIGINKALEFLYLGGKIDARQAYEMGILNKIVEPDEMEKEAFALAKEVAAGPPVVLRLIKMQVYKGLNMSLDQALELAADCEAMTLKTHDHKSALAAFFKKEKASFVGR